MDEFDFIKNLLAPLAGPEGLELKDDAAIYSPPAGFDLVLATDTMVEGVHFPKGRYGGDVAERLLRVNLSDIAAKAARPVGYLLNLSWPKSASKSHFAGFVAGLRDIQSAFDFKLFGGDTTVIDGPFVVSATLLGLAPKGKVVKRSSALSGHDIWLTGTIGDACLGLKYVMGQSVGPNPSGEALWHWEEAYLRPEPRILLRKLLQNYATSSIDISDGLIADLNHICNASIVGMKILFDKIPLSKPSRDWMLAQNSKEKALRELITHGDDYEIAFTASPDDRQNILDDAQKLGLRVSLIGECVAGKSVILINIDGEAIKLTKTGYRHF